MTTASISPPVQQPAALVAKASLGWLCALFFLSGISGLMYEVVWVRMLTRILGSTVYATSTVLAAFMAGLTLGSLIAGCWVDRARRPLRWYALLELGIGISALATLLLTDWLLPVYQAIYNFAGGARAWLTAGQVVVALLVLLLPTALMGATLPTLCAHGSRRHVQFGRCVGVLYAFNTLGALIGVLSSGFVLLGEVGETLTVAIGVALNLAVAIAVGRLDRKRDDMAASPAGAESSAAALYSARCRGMVVATFACSGFVAMASEVIWGRMLLLYQGPSIYSFSSMLAVVLGGIGLGSLIGGSMLKRWRDPLRLLAVTQLAIGLATLVSLQLFPHLSPGVLLPALILLGPLGLLWGLSFPLGAACYGHSEARAGRSIAELYAWNTVGCIAGSLGAGFLMVPLLGSSSSLGLIAVISLAVGLGLLAVHPDGVRRRLSGPEPVFIVLSFGMLVLLDDPYYQALEQRMLAWYPSGIHVERHVEEAAATTTVFSRVGGEWHDKQLWVNGQGMTCLAPVTKLMAHLPIALADKPRAVLVMCIGMGTSVRSACAHSGVHVRAVELIPAVARSFGFFHPDVPHLLEQPNVEVIVDDGRNYLLMHPDKHDVITLDPPPPLWAAGTVNLYSRDFLTLCRARLNPKGVICVWVQPDRMSENKMLFQTFLDVFQHAHVWAGPAPHTGFLLIGSLEPLLMAEVPAKVRKLYDDPAVAADLRAWGDTLGEPDKILDLYVGSGGDLRGFCGAAPVLTDDRPYTEFPLWRSFSAEYHQFVNGLPYKLNRAARNPYQ